MSEKFHCDYKQCRKTVDKDDVFIWFEVNRIGGLVFYASERYPLHFCSHEHISLWATGYIVESVKP
jgi:hypothetical protein